MMFLWQDVLWIGLITTLKSSITYFWCHHYCIPCILTVRHPHTLTLVRRVTEIWRCNE